MDIAACILWLERVTLWNDFSSFISSSLFPDDLQGVPPPPSVVVAEEGGAGFVAVEVVVVVVVVEVVVSDLSQVEESLLLLPEEVSGAGVSAEVVLTT